MTAIKKLFEYLLLFVIGGTTYCLMELMYKGSTHLTMFFCGGITLIVVGGINEVIPWEMPIQYQCLIGCVFITALELAVGLIFNRDFSIWDYRQMPLNFMGQICLTFSLIWYVLSGIAIVLDDYLRYFLFHEEKPHYKL